MKITRSQLKQIIKEEVYNTMRRVRAEASDAPWVSDASYEARSDDIRRDMAKELGGVTVKDIYDAAQNDNIESIKGKLFKGKKFEDPAGRSIEGKIVGVRYGDGGDDEDDYISDGEMALVVLDTGKGEGNEEYAEVRFW